MRVLNAVVTAALSRVAMNVCGYQGGRKMGMGGGGSVSRPILIGSGLTRRCLSKYVGSSHKQWKMK